MTLKLFVADDSVTIQKIVSLAFSGEDVAVEAVSDGDSAMESLQRFKPDIVLADVFMPGCNGYEVCARIKDNPELKHIPVILLVGTFEPFDEAEAVRAKYDACLTKPFDTSELIQTVYRLTGGKASSAQSPDAGCENSSTPVSKSSAKWMVSRASWESFLGENRVLDLLDPTLQTTAMSADRPRIRSAEKPAPETLLSEEALNLVVDRVVRAMSPEVIREVAWEVVPELSESIIRRTIKNQEK